MRALLVMIFISLLGCRVSSTFDFNTKISKKILVAQGKNRSFAIRAYGGREVFLKKIKKLSISDSDTLFMFERIGNPDLDIWSNVWTSKRNVVYEYRQESEIMKDTVINYKIWQNNYKGSIERFDTAAIDNHTILGGYRSFITQVIPGKAVRTFYFHDSYSSFTPEK